MAFRTNGRKRYGKRRKPGPANLWTRPKKHFRYSIAEGTPCHIRKLGTKTWRAYKTKRAIDCTAYLWRNDSHHGFAVEGYEVKVYNTQFTLKQVG